MLPVFLWAVVVAMAFDGPLLALSANPSLTLFSPNLA
jgi:hypothetical protein